MFPEDESASSKANETKKKTASSSSKNPYGAIGMKRPHRGEHLRLFYDSVVWKPSRFHIDDLKTARRIIETQASDWPLMKFQFACCYAMDDLLEDDFLFDRIRRRTFK